MPALGCTSPACSSTHPFTAIGLECIHALVFQLNFNSIKRFSVYVSFFPNNMEKLALITRTVDELVDRERGHIILRHRCRHPCALATAGASNP